MSVSTPAKENGKELHEVSAMTTDSLKALAVLFLEEQDRLKGGPASHLCSPDYLAYMGSNAPIDLSTHQESARHFYAAFSNSRHTVNDIVAEGNKVAVRFSFSGQHTGDSLGIPATQRVIEISGIAIFHIQDGKVSELHAQVEPIRWE